MTVEVTGRYKADIEAKATVTLLTYPERLDQDLAAFKTLVRSVRSCSSVWYRSDTRGRTIGKPTVVGQGPRCPVGARWF